MVILLFDEKKIELKTIKGTLGNDAIDVRGVLSSTGCFLYDPGFMSTASCRSEITYIDGEKGLLLYRGHNVVDLAQKYDFLTVSYLLLNNKLPNKDEHSQFVKKIAKYSNLDETVKAVINSLPRSAHPMSIIMSANSALAALHEDNDPIIAIAQMPTIVAAIYRHINNLPLIESNTSLGYVENFLYMMFGDDKPSKILVDILNIIFVLHADHEQNASTATVRTAASSGAKLLLCNVAGCATLSGPAHGGANEAAIKMLNEIASVDNVYDFVQQVKDKKRKLMGFGHRVYKNHDPRATLLHQKCPQVLEACNKTEEDLFKIAVTLEECALQDEYFRARKLYPNVDFYSGIILQAIGIPQSMFTTIFALARTVGWCAQFCEMVNDKEQKITRPRQVYTGFTHMQVDSASDTNREIDI